MNEVVAFLDDDDDLRASVRELLDLEYERPCIALGSHAELLEHAAEVLACKLAILDVNLGPNAPSGVDAYRWLRDNGFRGHIVFLTGHARSNPLVERAVALGDARVFEKPITMERLESLLDATR